MAPKGKEKQAKKAAVGDARFAAVGTDPRFRRFPKTQAKVDVDERFAGMFTDEAFQGKASVDKRGRKVSGKGKAGNLRSYYRLEGEASESKAGVEQLAPEGEGEEEEKAAGNEGASSGAAEASEQGSESGSESEVDELAEADERWARMRGLAGPSSSEGEDGSESEAEEGESDAELRELERVDAEEEARAERLLGVGAMAVNPAEQIPLVADATPRLACVDLDWDHVRAVDIMVVLRSFAPAGGAVRRVAVYPSDYGLQRMAEEAEAGPRGIWDAEDADGEAGEASDDDDKRAQGLQDDIARRRLRAYELARLRYYYAVVECDGAATASRIYEECDGMEFLKSACKFDLRFVPEGQSFEGRQVRDAADDVPADYAPPAFQTKALQHTNVELTWDAGDTSRKAMLNRKVTEDEIREDDFKAYLASESESSDEEQHPEGDVGAEAVRQRYQAFLLGPEAGAGARGGKSRDRRGQAQPDEEEEEEEGDTRGATRDKDMELEVTFQPGLESLAARLAAKAKGKGAGKKKSEAEAVWDAYTRRREEKRAQAARLGRPAPDSDDDSEPEAEGSGSDDEALPEGVADDPFFARPEGEDPFDDPFFNSEPGEHPGAAGEAKKSKPAAKKGKARRGDAGDAAPEAAARKAELEMLLLDEQSLLNQRAPAGADAAAPAKKLSKKERMRLKKAARRAEREHGSDDEGVVLQGKEMAGPEDPRFSALLTSNLYALDPTDPRYKAAGDSLVRKVKDLRRAGEAKPAASRPRPAGPAASKPEGGENLRSIVDSLKRKAGSGGGAGRSKQPKH